MNQASSALRVILADDHPVFLNGLRALLQTDPMFEIVAVCPDGKSALQAILESKPDLAILDVSMPGCTGVEVLAELSDRDLTTRVILLTASAGDGEIVEAVARGVYGLMLKDAAADTLLDCMRSVAVGRRWLPPDLVGAAVKREEDNRAKVSQLDNALTSREREIVTLVAEGQSNKEIARKLGLADGTVKIHLHRIYNKLGVSNRTSLTALALNYRKGPPDVS
ncbi:response regulator transcription factor [Microvirga aerilata]|uniref:Response regulator transcription factor n=1 Tax=Microvirga aerilata TaxID=670292 RepID=A0A936ZCL0_9HYPH|nr:response regulator transcription factor [Microvirga aerilata]MBL0408381.1 response regulator transcription factor [Microvirga aerilata]